MPQQAATQGRSEAILGAWLRQLPPAARDRLILATKVAGPGGMPWLRGGPHALDARNIRKAIDGSLARLGVDRIDLLQLHWPDRLAAGVQWAGGWQACAPGRGRPKNRGPVPPGGNLCSLRPGRPLASQICAHVWRG